MFLALRFVFLFVLLLLLSVDLLSPELSVIITFKRELRGLLTVSFQGKEIEMQRGLLCGPEARVLAQHAQSSEFKSHLPL